MKRILLAGIIVALCAGCAPSRDSFIQGSQKWLRRADEAKFTVVWRLKFVGLQVGKNPSKDELVAAWKPAVETFSDENIRSAAVRLRSAFNELNQPPENLRDVYDLMRSVTERTEEMVSRQLGSREDPDKIWDEIWKKNADAESQLAVIKLRLGT